MNLQAPQLQPTKPLQLQIKCEEIQKDLCTMRNAIERLEQITNRIFGAISIEEEPKPKGNPDIVIDNLGDIKDTINIFTNKIHTIADRY